MEITRTPTFTLSRRIGSTVYRVNAYGSSTSTATLEDRIIHIVSNEVLASDSTRGIMNMPQMGRQPERSAS